MLGAHGHERYRAHPFLGLHPFHQGLKVSLDVLFGFTHHGPKQINAPQSPLVQSQWLSQPRQARGK
jgi:hypothetical protein